MGQGGAGALAVWAKQLGRSARGGWVNECISFLGPVVMFSFHANVVEDEACANLHPLRSEFHADGCPIPETQHDP